MLTFDTTLRISNLVLVGCGGTGTHLARHLARILFDMRRNHLQTPTLTFVDPDIVEAKNIGRQAFTEHDIGGYKSDILMRRFNLMFGLDILSRAKPFQAKDVTPYNTLLIGAVDNHQARIELNKVKDGLWLDCGNHKNAGQVILGNAHTLKEVRAALVRARNNNDLLHRLPNAALIFPELLLPEQTPTTLSCADLMRLNEQHLLVNDFVANIAAAYVYALLHRQPILHFMSFVSLDGLTVNSKLITEASLLAYMKV